MDLEKTLKNLKHIEANKDYAHKSRVLILHTSPVPRSERIFNVILRNIELAASVGLAGVLVFLIFGGFSAWKFLTPLNVSGLDPAALKAEADAVDIQIQLTNLAYGTPAAPAKSPVSTLSAAGPEQLPPTITATSTHHAESIATSSPYVPVDEALDTLSQ